MTFCELNNGKATRKTRRVCSQQMPWANLA